MRDSFYYDYGDGFSLHAVKVTCPHCGEVSGLVQAINSGVSHINQVIFTCLPCLQNRVNDGKIPDELPGLRKFVAGVLTAG